MPDRHAMRRRTAELCLRCSGEGVPVIYGRPDDELFAAAEAGLVSIGGCIIPSDVDVATCRRCGELWSPPSG